MDEPVRYDVAGGVGTITFNRPDCGNAWSPELRECYLDRVDEVRRDQSARVVVITGAGRSFCVGADLTAVADGDFAAADQHRSASALYDLHKPVVAAINGGCAGMGLVQALQADLRFASDSAKITTSFARRGLVA
jgi:2-(1,2-epoxy-1,2-dihydrophenyl)acetyl-CoA isomerase